MAAKPEELVAWIGADLVGTDGDDVGRGVILVVEDKRVVAVLAVDGHLTLHARHGGGDGHLAPRQGAANDDDVIPLAGCDDQVGVQGGAPDVDNVAAGAAVQRQGAHAGIVQLAALAEEFVAKRGADGVWRNRDRFRRAAGSVLQRELIVDAALTGDNQGALHPIDVPVGSAAVGIYGDLVGARPSVDDRGRAQRRSFHDNGVVARAGVDFQRVEFGVVDVQCVPAEFPVGHKETVPGVAQRIVDRESAEAGAAIQCAQIHLVAAAAGEDFQGRARLRGFDGDDVVAAPRDDLRIGHAGRRVVDLKDVAGIASVDRDLVDVGEEERDGFRIHVELAGLQLVSRGQRRPNEIDGVETIAAVDGAGDARQRVAVREIDVDRVVGVDDDCGVHRDRRDRGRVVQEIVAIHIHIERASWPEPDRDEVVAPFGVAVDGQFPCRLIQLGQEG